MHYHLVDVNRRPPFLSSLVEGTLWVIYLDHLDFVAAIGKILAQAFVMKVGSVPLEEEMEDSKEQSAVAVAVGVLLQLDQSHRPSTRWKLESRMLKSYHV